jgi:outer membrane lipoprotein-sorting protein
MAGNGKEVEVRTLLGLGILAVLACGGGRCAGDAGVDAVLGRWVDSVGGRTHLESVKSYEVVEGVDFGSGSPVNRVRILRTKTGQFRMETSNQGLGTLVKAWDGMIGWQSNDRLGSGFLSPADVTNLSGLENLLIPLFVKQGYNKQRVIGPALVGGRNCTVLGMAAGSRPEEKWYFDDASGRLVRVDQPQPGQPGDILKTDYMDFRPEGGLVEPFVVKTAGQGGTAVVTRESVTINPPTDAATFMISTARLAEMSQIQGILNRNLAQAGGDAITKIHSRIKRVAIDAPESAMKHTVTTYQKEPNLFLREDDTPGEGVSWLGFDGSVLWSCSDLAGFHLQGSAAVAQWKKVGNLADEGRQLVRIPLRRMLGARQVDGRAAHAVVLSDYFSEDGTCYFDDGNGRMLRLTSVFSDGHGQQEGTQDFSDFRRIDGVEIPFVTTDTNASGTSVETIVSLQNNVPIDDGIFKPRRGDW